MVEHEEHTETPIEVSQVTAPEHTPQNSLPAPPTLGMPMAGSPHNTSKKKLYFMLAGLATAIIIVVGAYFLVFKDKKPAQNTQTTAASSQTKPVTSSPAKPAVAVDPLVEKFKNPTTGEKWYDAPKEVSDLGYSVEAKNCGEDSGATTTYYELGTHGTSTIYLSDTSSCGPGGDSLYVYEKASSGKVSVILYPDANAGAARDGSVTDEFRANVTQDSITHYDSMTIPKQLSIGNSESVTPQGYYTKYGSLGNLLYGQQTIDSAVKKTTLQTLGSNKLIKIEKKYSDTKLTAVSYAIDTPIGTEIGLAYDPISADLSTYSWNNGVTVTTSKTDASAASIQGIVRGCGSAGGSVGRADAVSDSDFVATGKTSTGQAVFEFKDSNHALVAKAYSEYKEAGQDSKPVSLQDFLKQHAIIAYKNKSNEWLIYTRDTYAPGGGCAKPVVYLYPAKSEQVSVQVGADVKKSVPFYNQFTGWNVWANPNGQLLVNGTVYDSLFWEGPGHGAYPGIVAGMVVKRSDVVDTIRVQLAAQGLNQKEIHDFLAYWTPKLPSKPYVRLTWFSTTQMNQLAPLHVSPKPDTIIRVFLDFAGLDAPINLPAQQLIAPARTGFTVVEWGGLSPQKLY